MEKIYSIFLGVSMSCERKKPIFTDADTQAKILAIPGFEAERLWHWLATPPRFTVLRKNPLATKTGDVPLEVVVKEYLEQQYRSRNKIEKLPHLVESPINDALIVRSSGLNEGLAPSGKVVVVGCLCGCAVLRGADVFAPGVLGCPSSLREGDVTAVYADVNGSVLRGTKIPSNFLSDQDSDFVFVGNGVARMSRDAIFKTDSPSGVAVEMTEPLFDCPSMSALADEGLITLQNLPSVLCGRILDPRPREMILDMCAAPGGKTTHIAELMGGEGTVVALDKSRNKVAQIESNCRRLKIPDGCVRCHAFDATKSCNRDASNSDLTSPPFPPETFDKVLLDAPCSALGQRPQLANRMGPKELSSFPRLQRRLLSAAVGLLKPGGTLVYSTCTVTLEENEHLVWWALKEHPCLRLEDAKSSLEHRFDGKAGIWQEGEDGLTEEECGKVLRFSCPTAAAAATTVNEDCASDTIGFFIAKFTKS